MSLSVALPESVETDLEQAVKHAIWHRCSVRRFSKQPIPRAKLETLVEAGVRAPSGSNWQNQRFLVIDEPSEIERIGKSRFVWPYRNVDVQQVQRNHPGGILGEGTALVVVFADSLRNDRRGNGEYYIWENLEIQNCAASIENMLIMATAMGIASCWVSASDRMSYTRLFSKQSWRSLLGKYDIPLHYKLQGIVVLGYPLRVDADGFPVGEKNHGATVWQSTQRQPLEHYCIPNRVSAPLPLNQQRPKRWSRLRIQFLRRVLSLSISLAQRCDRAIHRLEIDRHLKP
jgi:nitroreductase